MHTFIYRFSSTNPLPTNNQSCRSEINRRFFRWIFPLYLLIGTIPSATSTAKEVRRSSKVGKRACDQEHRLHLSLQEMISWVDRIVYNFSIDIRMCAPLIPLSCLADRFCWNVVCLSLLSSRTSLEYIFLNVCFSRSEKNNIIWVTIYWDLTDHGWESDLVCRSHIVLCAP